MRTVHLRMMELERYCECCFQQAAFIFSPDHERIVENTAVHPYGSVYIIFNECRCPYDHAFCQIMIYAVFGCMACELEIDVIELLQIRRKWYVARVYLSVSVHDYRVDCNGVELHQLISFGQHIELFDTACRHAAAPAHEHIEFHSVPTAVSYES